MTTPSGQTGPRWKGAGSTGRLGSSTAGASVNRGKLYLLLAGVVILAGAIIAFLTWPRGLRPPAFLALPLDQHQDERVPPVQFSQADRTALRSYWSDSHDAFNSQERRSFEEELKSIGKRSGKEGIVIFLTGRVVADSKDRLALVLADSSLDRPESWYPLDDLFKHLKDYTAGPKLLLLDLAQPNGDRYAGLFANDAASRLDVVLRKAVDDDGGLRIITACSPGQVSLASEELGHTAFAFFLAQGMSGAAEQKKDGRLTLEELTDYLRREVDAWAWRGYRRRQVPRVYGEGKEFVLSSLSEDTPSAEATPISEEFPPWLGEGWKKRDAWLKDQSFRAVVGGMEELERRLLHAEHLWRHGAAKTDQDRAQEKIGKLLVQLEQERRTRAADLEPPETASLAWAVWKKDGPAGVARLSDAPSPEVIKKLERFAERKAQVDAAKPPNEGDKNNLAGDITKFVKEYEGKSLELAGILVGAASNRRPSRELVVLLAELVPKDLALTREMRALKKLAELKVEAPAGWPDRAAGRYIQAVLLSEVLGVSDPAALAWFEDGRRASLGRTKQGEQMLFGPDAAARSAAEESLRQAAGELEQTYQFVQIVQVARQVRDEILLELPSYAAYVDELGTDDPGNRTALLEWREAADYAAKLRDLVAAGPAAKSGPALDRQLNDLRTLAARLKKPGDWKDLDYLKTLRLAASPSALQATIAKSVDGRPADLQAMKALLRLSRLDAGQRLQLWKAYRDLAGQLHAPHVDREDRPAWGDAEEARARRLERDAAIRRARLSVTLLRLHGRAGLEAVETELAEAESGKSQLPATFGEKLRAFWAAKSRP